MSDLNIERYSETDASDDEENHSKLLNSVSQLDSTQRVKPAQRKEVASEVSEFNLSRGNCKKNLVHVKELVKVLGEKAKHGEITKRVNKVLQKSGTLPTPLEKPVEERLKRSVGFENVKKQLQKWDAVVVRNALKDQIIFPLNDFSIKKLKSSEFLSQFKTPTPLEKEIAKVLKQDCVEEIETEDNEFPLTFEEMMEKRKEMAKLRAQLSYKQSKAQRQSKIKSKKYHRLIKREKLRQQLKEFEMLQKTNPEAALKKLSELDRTRAQERASLRHRNTGQWAKNLTVKAKYDVETRKVLADQLKISRELTQKVSQLENSDDDNDDGEKLLDSAFPSSSLPSQTANTSSSENPWVLEISREVQDFVSGYKKFWSENGTEINQEESKGKQKESEIINNQSCEVEEESKDKISVKNCSLIQNNEISESNDKIHETDKMCKRKITPHVTSKKLIKANSKRKQIYVTEHPTSGIWIVTSVTDESDSPIKKKKKAEDIDTLFDELNDKLLHKAKKKIKKIKAGLKKSEKIKAKTNESKEECDLSLKITNVAERPEMDIGLLENGVENQVVENPLVNTTVSNSKSSYELATIDPQKFIQVKPKRLKTHLPENITGEEEGLDDEKAQQSIIEEAFGDDDVMAEFKEMKEEEEKNNNIELKTSLPGWGTWGGTGIVPKIRKKQRLVLNLPPRKDKLKKDMIINENENPNLRNHLVKNVPHPFKSVEAFEANIRAPIGREWVPETAHQKLVQKQVVTKLGSVIEPMSEEEIISLKKVTKSPYQGIKK